MSKPLYTYLFFTLLALTFSINVKSQCIDVGEEINSNDFLGSDDLLFEFSLDGSDLTFSSVGGMVTMTGPSGMEFQEDIGNTDFVENLTSGIDASTLTNYSAGPLKLWEANPSPNGFGTFAEGNGGFVAVKYNGEFGWVEFEACGFTTCGDYMFSIVKASLGSPITGECEAMEPIPTLGEWGLIILTLTFMILGLTAIKQESLSVIYHG